MSDTQTLTLSPLATDLEFLKIVSQWDSSIPYQDWQPQILLPEAFAPARPPRVFVVANNKGGVGKTTTAVELAAAFAAAGLRVRLIDADPQGAAISEWLELTYPADVPASKQYSLRHIFLGDPETGEDVTLDQATWPTRFKGLHLVPSSSDLSRVEYERPIGAENALRLAIEESTETFDVTVIDASRTMSVVTIAALIAGQDVIVPVKVGVLDARGMADLDATLNKVKKKANPKLNVAAVLLTMFDKSLLARQLGDQVAEDYPSALIAPVRRSIRVSEAPGSGKPVRLYAPDSTASADYQQISSLLLGGRR